MLGVVKVQNEGEEDSSEARLSILLLCDNDQSHTDALLNHIESFVKHSIHKVYIFNPRWLRTVWSLDLDEFDVVIIHWSLHSVSDYYICQPIRQRIRSFAGLKIQFVQDDYRRVDAFAAMMRYFRIHILFTLYPENQIDNVWSKERLPGVKKFGALAGYVPDNLVGLHVAPLGERPIDVGYRGRTLPYWLGKLAQEKVQIAQGFRERADRYNLSHDIAWREEDRIYGTKWIEFIKSCKVMLGTESGASITDFDGTVEQQVKQYLAEHPNATFEEVSREVLPPYEGNVPINVISPRVFEAITLRTALVMFPGEYSGIVRPWEHYIPLEKDFSNMDEVAEKIRDTGFLSAMTERAYQDIIASGRYSYRKFIDDFDAIVNQYGRSISKNGKVRYRLAKIERIPHILIINELLRTYRRGRVLARIIYRTVRPLPE